MEKRSYYTILGVSEDASTDDVKKAYRELCKKYHPDVSKSKNAEIKFKKIKEAYDVLSDPEKREAYDLEINETYAPQMSLFDMDRVTLYQQMKIIIDIYTEIENYCKELDKLNNEKEEYKSLIEEAESIKKNGANHFFKNRNTFDDPIALGVALVFTIIFGIVNFKSVSGSIISIIFVFPIVLVILWIIGYILGLFVSFVANYFICMNQANEAKNNDKVPEYQEKIIKIERKSKKIKEDIDVLVNNINEANNGGDIHPDFMNKEVLSLFMEYLEEGACDNLKECVKQYRSEMKKG